MRSATGFLGWSQFLCCSYLVGYGLIRFRTTRGLLRSRRAGSIWSLISKVTFLRDSASAEDHGKLPRLDHRNSLGDQPLEWIEKRVAVLGIRVNVVL